MTDNVVLLLPDAKSAKFDSRHRVVVAAAQRAKQLIQGARPSSSTKFRKETTIALEEVLTGQVSFLTGKEARQAMKDAKRARETEIERVVTLEASEDAREIKKELSVYVDDSAKGPAPEGAAE